MWCKINQLFNISCQLIMFAFLTPTSFNNKMKILIKCRKAFRWQNNWKVQKFSTLNKWKTNSKYNVISIHLFQLVFFNQTNRKRSKKKFINFENPCDMPEIDNVYSHSCNWQLFKTKIYTSLELCQVSTLNFTFIYPLLYSSQSSQLYLSENFLQKFFLQFQLIK